MFYIIFLKFTNPGNNLFFIPSANVDAVSVFQSRIFKTSSIPQRTISSSSTIKIFSIFLMALTGPAGDGGRLSRAD